jgi:putative nucleotidyltransferase with HDIG domain
MFGGFFNKKKSAEVAQPDAKLSTAVAQSIFNVVGAHSIPTMPAAAQKAFQLATDPRAEARDFISVIESDEALSARVMKIANSVYFDRGKPSTTIEDSVIIIGINELRCLLNATSLAEVFPSKHTARTQLWANDIATALIARTLAERFLPAKAEIAFLAGLMHDIGKLLLLQRAGDLYLQVLKKVEQEDLSFGEAEEQLFPFTHTEVGHLIAERWHFSPEIIAVIRGHHTPPDEVGLTTIVHAADAFAHALGLGHPRGFGKFQNRVAENLPHVWERLKITTEEHRGLLQRFQQRFDLEYDLYAGKGIPA